MEIKLKKLIKLCNDNIKGMTSKNDLIELLPISEENIKIDFQENYIYIKSKNEIKKIYEQNGFYLNLDILKEIAKIHGISLNSNKILDLIKFKNIIEITLL